jgi:hypothetical protein
MDSVQVPHVNNFVETEDNSENCSPNNNALGLNQGLQKCNHIYVISSIIIIVLLAFAFIFL